MAEVRPILGVTVNPAQIAEVEELMKDLGGSTATTQILVGAINKASRKAATSVRRRLAAQTGLPVRMFGSGDRGMVRPLLSNYEQGGQAEGGIRILNYNIPLQKFRRTALSLATRAATSKAGELSPVQAHPFRRKTDKKGSHQAPIFAREGSKVVPTKGRYAGRLIKIGPRAGQPMLRQPIKKLYGPSPRKAFEAAPAIAEEVIKEIGDDLDRQIWSQVDRRLKQRRK